MITFYAVPDALPFYAAALVWHLLLTTCATRLNRWL